MTAAIALMFLAEATVTCAPGGAASRLRAGATIVRAIAAVEQTSFEALPPTSAASGEPADAEEHSGSPEAQEPEADQPATQCEDVERPTA